MRLPKRDRDRLSVAERKITSFGPSIRKQLVENGNSERDWYNVLEAIRNLLDGED